MSSMDMLKITKDSGLVLAQQHTQAILEDLSSVMIGYPQNMIWYDFFYLC